MASEQIDIIVKIKDEATAALKSIKDEFNWDNQVASSQKASLAIGVMAAAAVAFGTKAVIMAGQVEQTTVAFTTMLGSAELADSFLKELWDFATKTPFTITGIETSAKSLMAMGISAEDIIPTLKSLGDVSAGLSVPLEQVAYAYGQVSSAGQLYGTELRQFVNAGVPILQELADMYGVTAAEAKKMTEGGLVSFADVEEAFRRMSSEGGQFADLMAVQATTLLGLWSNLSDQFTLTMRAIGEPILTYLKPILADLVVSLSEVRAAIQEMDFVVLWEENKDAVIIFAAAITGMMIPALTSAAIAIGSIIISLAPYSLAIAAITTVVIALADEFDISFENIKEYFSSFITAIMKGWDTFNDVINSVIDYLNDDVLPAFEDFFDGIIELLEILINKISPYWDDFLLIAQTTWDFLSEYISRIASVILNTIGVFGNTLSKDWEGLWNNILSLMAAILGQTETEVVNRINGMIGAFNAFIAAVNSATEQFGISISSISYLASEGEKKVVWAMDSMTTKTGGLKSSFEDLAGTGGGGGGGGGASSASSAIEDLTEALGDAEETMLSLQLNMTEGIKEINTTFAEQIAEIDENIAALKESMADLTAEFLDEEAADREELAEAIVASEQNIADWQSDLDDEKAKDAEDRDEEEIAALEEKILKEQEALEANKQYQIDLENEIAEVKRWNGLTELEQAIETYNEKRVIAQNEYDATMTELQDQLELEEIHREDVYLSAEGMWNKIHALEDDAEILYQDLLDNNLLATEDYVDAVILELDRINEAIKSFQSVTFSSGGLVKSYAQGGMVYAADGFQARGTDTVPAMLTPGELVLNASQQKALAGQMSGITININNPYVLSTDDVMEKIGNPIMKEFKKHFSVATAF